MPTADVTADATPDFHLEIKRQERIEIEKWCRQAEAECGRRFGIVLWRRSRQPWRVTLTLEAFVAIAAPYVRQQLAAQVRRDAEEADAAEIKRRLLPEARG